MGIFIILISSGAGFVLPSLRINRLSGNVTDATLYAQEGIEAARSIRNQGWTTPFLGTSCGGGCGISTGGGSWTWSGVNTTKSPYTRVITVSPVLRDGSGNVVTSGGSDDPNTKKVTSIVSWNFTAVRPETVTLVTYLTNWGGGVVFSTCDEYAQSLGYTSGTCRQSAAICTINGETHLVAGDTYCPGGSMSRCCAFGIASTPTPTPTTGLTPTPTIGPTLTPTPIPPPPTTCNGYCISLGIYTQGTCRKGAAQCQANGETSEPGGNSMCAQATGGLCCCK